MSIKQAPKGITETLFQDENGRLKRSIKYETSSLLEGHTIREFLQNELHFSKRQISSLKYREDGIRVNGSLKRVTYVLKQGDILEIVPKSAGSLYLNHGSFTEPPEILYEDGDLLIVNKPSGMVCHPSHGHYSDTLANQAAAYCASKGESWTIRLVGRLDKDTSGIVVFAKNSETAALLSRKIPVEKTYYAVAEGTIVPESGVIDSPIASDEAVLGKMKLSDSGKPARTCYKVLKTFSCCSLLKVRICHGRTHQIRLHLASIGHPLMGDALYGHGEKGKTHAMLHCGNIRFLHPFTGIEVFAEAPFPEDWSGFVPV